MKAIDQLSTSSETGADSAETEQQSLAAAEIEARLARVIEEMRAQLAEMEHSAQAAAAEERRLEGETEQARARETALDNRATVLHQAITVARADLAMARGTADEPTVQSELDQRKVSYLDAVEQQAEATQRIHDLAEQLVVSRSARASLEAEQSSKRIELEGVVAELERRRAEAHSARGQAELERIIAEIAEQERSIAAAQEALTAAQGKLDATRREVSTRMAKWPMLRDRFEQHLPRETTREGRICAAWAAYLRVLEAEAGHGVPLIYGRSLLGEITSSLTNAQFDCVMVAHDGTEYLARAAAQFEHWAELLRQRNGA